MKSISDLPLTPQDNLAPDFIALCRSITQKRPRAVIEHILKNGYVTNEDLKAHYGYDHPPRAIRDVRESGIPLLTHIVRSPTTGRRMGAYTFDDVTNIRNGRIGGRRAFPKAFKAALLARYGGREAITGDTLADRYLQIDHRIPYEISGDTGRLDVEDFMLLDASSQRSKSWSCEHCKNWQELRKPEICEECFWAFPESYSHIAMKQKRRVEIVWSGDEVENFETVAASAASHGMSLADYIKRLLEK